MGLFQEEKRKEILLQSSIFNFESILLSGYLVSFPSLLLFFLALFLLLFRCPIFVLFSFFFAALFRCPISHFSAANYPLCWLPSFIVIFSLFFLLFAALVRCSLPYCFAFSQPLLFSFLQPLFAVLFAPFRSTFLPLFLLIALSCLAFSCISKTIKEKIAFKNCTCILDLILKDRLALLFK